MSKVLCPGGPLVQCWMVPGLFSVFRDLFSCLLVFVRPELVVKKLRYYARYIVVCLLLNKMDLVKVLVKVRAGLRLNLFTVHGL